MRGLVSLTCGTVLCVWLWWTIAPACAETAEAGTAARVDALLAGGEFDAALDTLKAAVAQAPQDQAWRDQFAILRQVVHMRRLMATESDPAKLDRMAQALRSFYYEHNLYSEAESLDRATHQRVGSHYTACQLAETLLELGRNAEAVEVLQAARVPADAPRGQVLLGIAAARNGSVDDARRIAETVLAGDEMSPDLLLFAARLHALTGDTPAALASLRRCFERTLPGRLERVKNRARACTDLEPLAAGPEFALVLETASKIKVSGCSGGTSCGKCPSRSKCASADRK